MLNWTYIEIEYEKDDGTRDAVWIRRREIKRIQKDAETLKEDMSKIKDVFDDVQKTVELANKLALLKEWL